MPERFPQDRSASAGPCTDLDADCSARPTVARMTRDLQDWMLHPSVFADLSTEFGPFTLDGAADIHGCNAFCDKYCSSRNSFLTTDLQGHNLYCNPPFDKVLGFLHHFLTQRSYDPSISGVFVLPVWPTADWWQLVIDHFQIVMEFPAGQRLFTCPGLDGTRLDVGPTRWPVVIVSSKHGTALGRATGLADSSVVQPSYPVPGCVSGMSAACEALVHRQHVSSPTTGIDQPVSGAAAGVANLCNTRDATWGDTTSPGSDPGNLPRLLYVSGRVADAETIVFLDSGAQLNLISSALVEKLGLTVDSTNMSVRFPNAQTMPLLGEVRGVTLRVGRSYRITMDFLVMDVESDWDVLLGKGWHDTANPQIDWPKNSVQIHESYPGPHNRREQEGIFTDFQASVWLLINSQTLA